MSMRAENQAWIVQTVGKIIGGELGTGSLRWNDEGFLLTLRPVWAANISPRALALCVNVLGPERKKRRAVHPYSCTWYLDPPAAGDRDLTIQVYCDDRCTWAREQMLVLEGCLQVGLACAEALASGEDVRAVPDPEHLLRVYRDREEVLKAYHEWATCALQSGKDEPGTGCDAALYKVWMCCPEHVLLQVQRLLFSDWLEFFARESLSDTPQQEQWGPGELFVPFALSQEELLTHLASFFRGFSGARETLWAHYAWDVLKEERLLDYPSPTCAPRRHSAMLCCPIHVAVSVGGIVSGARAEILEERYHFTVLKGRDGHALPSVFSAAWVALLADAEGIDLEELPLPSWFHTGIDLSYYTDSPPAGM